MAVDTRSATEGPRKRTKRTIGYVEEAGGTRWRVAARHRRSHLRGRSRLGVRSAGHG